MKEHIENYISCIDKEVKDKIQKDFNLGQNFFSKYKSFDFVNFHLIHNYILNEYKQDFFMGIPENEYRPNFFSVIFHSLVLAKLYQNYFTYEKTSPPLDIGDLICTKRGKEYRTLKVLGFSGQGICCNYKFPRKNENGINNFILTNTNFTKLNPHFVENKNVVKNIQSYRDFLDSVFTNKFPFITDFKNRTLVIAEKRFYTESKLFPTRYRTKTGTINNDLPFYTYLIECCNDFETAKKYFFDNGESFDELIIIGDSKYRECFSNIQEIKWAGKVKNIILIGTNKPSQEFIEWNWSKDEICIANVEVPKLPLKASITHQDFLNKLIELKTELEDIKAKNGVNLLFLLRYTNFYCRLLLVDSNVSKGICQEYCDRLHNYFRSEKFEEEINKEFYEHDIYNSEIIQALTDKIFSIFEQLSEIMRRSNIKWEYIKEKASGLKSGKLYLIVEKKSFDLLANQIKNEKIFNIELVSDKRIDNNRNYLEKWINDCNRDNNNYIIPYLNSIWLLDRVNLLKGNCEVLCYKEIDEIAFDNVLNQYENEEKKKLTHIDRNKFVQTTFCMNEEFLQRQLDDIFKFDITNENFRNNPYESVDLPKEKVNYEIEFNDGNVEKFESSKGIFLIEDNEQIKTTIGEIYEEATIRYYQNDNKEESRKILKIFDTENLLETFDKFATSWKQTLKNLLLQYENIESLYNKLFSSTYKINYNTFRLYFDDNSDTRFPRKKTLETIRDLCMKQGWENELIVKEFDKFEFYSKKDHAIRQQAGKIIGSDLIDYVSSNNTERSESLKKIPNDILGKLVGTIKEKTIKKKTLLDYE